MASRAPAPPPRKPLKPIVSIGPNGNITQNGDWVVTAQSYDLTNTPTKHGLSLYGGNALTGYGNDGGTSKLNTLTAASNTGNTTLIAGTASTTIIGGSGDNLLDASSSKGTVSLKGGSGNSTMYAANGLATLVGGGKNNFLVAGRVPTRTQGQSLVGGTSASANNILYGGTGRDTLRSGAGYNTLFSGSSANGSNILLGGGVSNSLVAGSGNDSLAAISGASTLVGGTGKDTLIAGTGSNSLVSGSTSGVGNLLNGNNGVSNTLVAGSGKDTLIGGTKQNLLILNQNNQTALASDSITLSSLTSAQNSLGLSYSSPVTIQDSLFGIFVADKVASLQTVEDFSPKSDRILLGANAQRVGVRTLVSGSGKDTLSIAGYASSIASSVLLNASLSSGQVSLVGGGSGHDTFIGSQGGNDTMVGVGNSNLFILSGGTNGLSGDSIIGGTVTGASNSTLSPYFPSWQGLDTLALSSPATLSGTANGTITHIQVLSLSGAGNNISGIGSSGIQNIIGGIGGGDTIDGSTSVLNIFINDGNSTLGDTLTASTVSGGGSLVASTLIGSRVSGNLFNVSTPLPIDSIVGGSGVDTLYLQTPGTYGDSLFTQDVSIDALQLTSNSNVTLGGNALAAGISTVIGGTGSDSFTSSATINGGFIKGLFINASLNTSASAYTGGTGNDTLLIGALPLTTSTLNGGGGTNLLEIATGGAVITGFGNNFSNFQELSLSGGGNSVSSIGSSGIQTILGGTGGSDTIDASTAASKIFINESSTALGDTLFSPTLPGVNATLIGSTISGNYFTVATEAALLADSLVGGTGLDTLVYGGPSLAAGDFSTDSLHGSINYLSLSGGGNQSFILDSVASATGISTVIAGPNGGDTLNATGYTTGSIFINASNAALSDTLITGSVASTLIGGQAPGQGNAFFLPTAANLPEDSLYGDLHGTDTLTFTSQGQNIQDSMIGGTLGSRMKSIDVISLTGGNNTFVGGNNFQAAGITTVYGGTGSNFLSAANMTSGSIFLNGAASTIGDTLSAATVAGSTNKSTLIGSFDSLATNYFQIGNTSLLGNDYLIGIGAKNNILQITSASQTLNDASFSKIGAYANLDELQLTGGKNTVLLGANAQKAFSGGSGSFTVIGGTGADSINALGITTSSVYIDGSASTLGDTLVAGAIANTLIGANSASPSSENLFIFNNASAFLEASIVGGGAGTNVLQFNGNNQTIVPGSFSLVSGINILSLSGSQDVVNMTGADSAGITTIVGGKGPSTVDGSEYFNPEGNTLYWNFGSSRGYDSLLGASSGNDFEIENLYNLTDTTLVGAATGTDTIQLLTGAQTIGDTAFVNDSLIGTIALTSIANGKSNFLTVGTNAENAGIGTIIGAASADTINASAYTNNVYIDGSAGTGDSLLGGSQNNTLIGATSGGNHFILDNSIDIASSSIVGGGTGTDTLAFSTASTLTPGNLSSVSDIGALEFLGNGGNIAILGLDASQAGIATLIGGQGNDTGGDDIDLSSYGTGGVVINVTDQSYLQNTTITGDQGVDTLQFSRNGVSVTDADFDHISGIQVLKTANGNNHFLLGNSFEAAGIQSLIGGTGHDTVDLTDTVNGYTPSRDITYNLGQDAGYAIITTIENLPYANIIGDGGGNNWLYLNNGGNVDDTLFSGDYQANINNLAFNGGTTNATLAGNAGYAGINDLYLGLNDWQDTLNLTTFTGKITIHGDITPNVNGTTNAHDQYNYGQGYNGEVLVQTSYAELSNITYIAHVGSSLYGSGSDSLQLIGTQARAITSDSLTGTFDALVLGDGNNFVQLEAADNTGLTSIFGGHQSDTINVEGFTTLQGVDLVVNLAQLPGDSLKGGYVFSGGKGNDTVGIAAGSTTDASTNLITDTNFSRMTDIQAFALDPNGGDDLDLGSTAARIGIHTVIGGLGNDTIDASQFAPTEWWNGKNYEIWNFDVILPNTDALATDSITGVPDAYRQVVNNALSKSILNLTAPDQVVYDSLFGNGNISNIQGLQMDQSQLDSLNGNFVALGSAALSEGIDSFNGGSGYSYLSVLNENYLLTTNKGGLQATLVGSTNARTKNNGYDTLTFSSDGQFFTDADFKNVSNFQVFQFNQDGTDPGSAVTLDANAMTTGFSSIYGGFGGSDSLTQAAGDTSALYINGVFGNGNHYSIATAAQLANDTIIGSGSGDTLNLGGDQVIADTLFANVSNVQAVTFATGANSITLGKDAQKTGITEVIGNTGNDIIDASGTSSAITLDGGGKATAADKLVSGSGPDTFVLGTASKAYYGTSVPAPGAAATDYAAITGFSDRDVLQLRAADSGSYTLGALANNGAQLTTHFGLYDHGNFVADITTNANFSVPTNQAGQTSFLNAAYGHVTYV